MERANKVFIVFLRKVGKPSEAEDIYVEKEIKTMVDPGFLRGGREPHRWGRQPITLAKFSKNCMKIKKFGAKRTFPLPSLRIRQEQRK